MNTVIEAERMPELEQAARRPFCEQGEAAVQTAPHAALAASALFVAGIVSFVVFERPAAPAAQSAIAPLPQSLPMPEMPAAADASVLVPLLTASSLAPQYEDVLVPFTAFGPISSEGPLPSLIPERVAPAAAFVAPPVQPQAQAAPETQEPMVEHAAPRATFQRLQWLTGGFRTADFTGGELRAQAARRAAAATALFAAARRNAQAQGLDPAQELYRKTYELNGGLKYTPTNTNDFSQGYGKVCSKAGYHCSLQGKEMVIETPEGARISHWYDNATRNHIAVTLADGLTKDLSHCPLVFDLGGRGVRTSDRPIRYDVDGKGRISLIHDIASTTGVLVFDADKNGLAGENGRELFGDGSDFDGDGLADGYRDGFEALAAFVSKAEKEGVLVPGTLERGQLSAFDLAVLGKRYGLGLRRGSLGARSVTAAEAGVREIALSSALSVRTANFDGQGNDVVRRQGASFARADGSTGAYEDVFFSYEKAGLKAVALAR